METLNITFNFFYRLVKTFYNFRIFIADKNILTIGKEPAGSSKKTKYSFYTFLIPGFCNIQRTHDIDCKIEGFGAMQLKSEFVVPKVK